MATRDDVIDAINRIERAGYAGELTRTAQAELLFPLPPREYDRILDRLRAAFPEYVTPSPLPAPRQPHPGDLPGQQGDAARAMKKAEAALSQQQSATAEFDRQVIQALLKAHTTTVEGRKQLDDLQAQIESATRTWNLSTPVGAREFQRFLLAKVGQIVTVVEEANDDDTAKRALAAAWTALYASQADADEPAAAAQSTTPSTGDPVQPEQFSTTDGDPYLDATPEDELDPGTVEAPPPGAPGPALGRMMPPSTGFGTESPGAGSLPFAGMPGGMAPAGPLPDSQYRDATQPLDGELGVFDEPVPPEDPETEPADDAQTETDTGAAETTPAAGPTTVRLPDGESTTAATPQLAAVIQAATSGTPVAEAFRQQGMTIPPPGTAVSAPVEQSRVSTGDVGMFVDRHALALGNSKALLDGQIQQIANVAGPSFLGWQHPPAPGESATPSPAPTRPSSAVRV